MPKRKYSLTSEESSLDSWELSAGDESSKEINDELKEAEKQERRAKAMESIQKLLSVSEKYSSVWVKRFESFKPIGNENDTSTRDAISKDTGDFSNLKYFTGKLRPYQLEGVKWMKTLFLGGINGILADEMGLGKTVQIIALLSYFLEKKLTGPHLIIGPLSTIPNWKNEFKRFSPQIPVVVFHGHDRTQLKYEIQKVHEVDNLRVKPVVITNYNTLLKEASFLKKIKWKYIVIDEAQRIKNHKSLLPTALREFSCMNKLLLTGTPLQNNMTELWSLLNFIMPAIFNNVDTFSSLFVLEDMEDKQMKSDMSENNTIISTIHKVLTPFMLRRLKKDVLSDHVPKKEVVVYCPMSDTQRKLYKNIIKKNVDEIMQREKTDDTIVPGSKRRCARRRDYSKGILDNDDEDEDDFPYNEYLSDEEEAAHVANEKKYFYNIKLQNPTMMFRKVVGHPYLISMPVVPGTREMVINEKLISESGKMLVLDAMLHKLKKKGHKVLIFSTFVVMLDLIGDYMDLRGYTYERLDGRNTLESRQQNIDNFNKDPNILAFLISTRAGGLGINLTGADTVIFFDRDWNPQADCQAQDRCHRIGQTKPVMIYTLVTKNTIDERMIKCGEMKRRLEKLIIKDGKFKMSRVEEVQDTMQELLKLLDSNIMSNVIHPNGYVFSDKELEKILDRSELYEEMGKKKLMNS